MLLPVLLGGRCMQVNLLPVVDDDNTVVGVVTRHDILRGIYASKSPLL